MASAASSAIQPNLRSVRYLLHDEATLAQVTRDAVALAAQASPGRAIAVATESAGITVRSRDGSTISAERNGGQSLNVTIIHEGRSGRASTSIFSATAIRAMVERAAFMVAQVEGDPDGEPADPERLAYDTPDVPLYAPSGLSVAALTSSAGAIEVATLAAAARQSEQVRVMETGAASSDSRWARAIGPDFCRTGSSSMQGQWSSVIAECGGRMASGGWTSSDRRMSAMQTPSTIAATAVDHAVRKLGGRSIDTRDCAVLFDAPAASSLIGEVMQALAGMAQYQKSTFLPDSLGKRVLAAHLDLIEDPFEPYGLASGAFDGEGIAGTRRAVIRDGLVEGYFLSTRSSRKLGMASTGNANGAWNLSLKSGLTEQADDLAAMLRRLDRGLWITDLLGGGVHPVTGAYSKAAAGFWIENGTVAHPVEDITISGSMPAMLADIVHVGADVHRSGGLRTGSVLVAQMRVAGR